MKNFKNGLTIALMISSIGLLLVLQAFWLRSAYNKAHDDLRKETNMLFRNTVFAMRDSMIQRNIETLPGDSAGRYFRFRGQDPFAPDDADSLVSHFHRRDHDPSTRIQVLMSPTDSDSAVKPMISRIIRNRGQGNFLFRFGQDSLRLDSIEINFRSALSAAAIDLPFKVMRMKRGEKLAVKGGEITSDPLRMNPNMRYAFIISLVQGRLLRGIIPQILFSVFVTLLTVGSFYAMYRSLMAQKKMAQLKNDFISNVTHELKTPITTVGVALEALRNFNGLSNPQVTREYLDIAQNELNRLTILTDKVLKTAIFEEIGVAYQTERVDLAKLTGQVLSSLKLVFEKSQAKVTFNEEGDDFTVSGGTDHLTNIIYNLIDNALKYSRGNPEIAIVLKTLPNEVTLSIQDQGPGIAPEYQKKIFEKFFRVPTGDVHNIKGYGLGLSYVAKVVHRHGGSITVHSVPGKGSLFVVTLPRG